MKLLFCHLLAIFAIVLPTASWAHEEPTSFLEIHAEPSAQVVQVIVRASAADVAHYHPDLDAALLLQRPTDAVAGPLWQRLNLRADGREFAIKEQKVTADPKKGDLTLTYQLAMAEPFSEITFNGPLFPYMTEHRTFVSIYEDKALKHQSVFSGPVAAQQHRIATPQGFQSVFVQFFKHGLHHIFIGLDHILFLVGLLLLRGTVRQLLGIVTAFTIAHSITLTLATLGILTPPAAVVEPIIAASVVIVGLQAMLGDAVADRRLWMAFGFGLVHGFGFAGVLQEMALPPQSLFGVLFSFNVGVEAGQAVLILLIAPFLAWLARQSRSVYQQVNVVAALLVTGLGGYWLVERLV